MARKGRNDTRKKSAPLGVSSVVNKGPQSPARDAYSSRSKVPPPSKPTTLSILDSDPGFASSTSSTQLASEFPCTAAADARKLEPENAQMLDELTGATPLPSTISTPTLLPSCDELDSRPTKRARIESSSPNSEVNLHAVLDDPSAQTSDEEPLGKPLNEVAELIASVCSPTWNLDDGSTDRELLSIFLTDEALADTAESEDSAAVLQEEGEQETSEMDSVNLSTRISKALEDLKDLDRKEYEATGERDKDHTPIWITAGNMFPLIPYHTRSDYTAALRKDTRALFASMEAKKSRVNNDFVMTEEEYVKYYNELERLHLEKNSKQSSDWVAGSGSGQKTIEPVVNDTEFTIPKIVIDLTDDNEDNVVVSSDSAGARGQPGSIVPEANVLNGLSSATNDVADAQSDNAPQAAETILMSDGDEDEDPALQQELEELLAEIPCGATGGTTSRSSARDAEQELESDSDDDKPLSAKRGRYFRKVPKVSAPQRVTPVPTAGASTSGPKSSPAERRRNRELAALGVNLDVAESIGLLRTELFHEPSGGSRQVKSVRFADDDDDDDEWKGDGRSRRTALRKRRSCRP